MRFVGAVHQRSSRSATEVTKGQTLFQNDSTWSFLNQWLYADVERPTVSRIVTGVIARREPLSTNNAPK